VQRRLLEKAQHEKRPPLQKRRLEKKKRPQLEKRPHAKRPSVQRRLLEKKRLEKRQLGRKQQH